MNSTWKRLLLFSFVIIVASIAIAVATRTKRVSAATITVMNTNDSGAGSLRQAIIDAMPGDTIDFAVTGTITLTSGELLINKNLTITGPDFITLTISGNNASRVFEINSGVTATISGITISDGNVTGGNGGGILNSGTLTLTNVVLSANSAGSSGNGGGIFNNGNLTTTGVTLSRNSADNGGGIYNNSGSTLTITKSTLSSNTTSSGGAGLFNGGALTITNSTVSGNSSSLGGGGIAIAAGAANISFSTLASNSASTSGGGIFVFLPATVNIKNSIVANNTAGGDCSNFGTWNATGTNFTTNGSCPGFTQVTPAQLNLGPLASNGGVTQTHALLVGSVAIDAVTDCTDVFGTAVTSDQRGGTRPIDGDGNGSALCDVGSFESQCLTCPSSITHATDPDQCGAVVNYPSPTTSGGCGAIGCSPESGSFFPKGTTIVTCSTKQDSPFGCSFTITVNDTQAPAITCPGNIVANADPGTCSTVINYTVPTATDNCDSNLIVTCAPASGSSFSKGTTTVTCTAKDSSGNVGSCSFTVTVNDTQPPSISCPPNQVGFVQPSCPISFPPPVASDNCPGLIVSCSPPSGSSFPVGQTTVNCTATDATGQTASCSFTVTGLGLCLQDETNPGNFVSFNAGTGEYSFFCNGVLIASGTGTLNVRGCQGSIEHIKGDRRVLIQWNTTASGGNGAGTAAVRLGPNNTKCQITDKNMINSTCATGMMTAPNGKSGK